MSQKVVTGLRVSIAVLFLLFMVGRAWLGGAGDVLKAAAPSECIGDGPVVMQGGPGAASPETLSEIVTGWYEFTLRANGKHSPIETTTCTTTAAPATPATASAAIVPTRSGKAIAQSWMHVDMRFFTPVYGLLLIGLLCYAASNRSYSDRSNNALLNLLQRAVRWIPTKKSDNPRPPWILSGFVVVGCLMDEFENHRMLNALDVWWTRLGASGTLTISPAELGGIHLYSGLKLGFLALPVLVALLIAAHITLTLIRLLWSSLRRLWVQLAAAVLFVVLCRIGQGADAIRRLSEPQWFLTAGVLVLFGLVLLLTGAGVLKPRRPATETTSTSWPATLLPAGICTGLGGVAIVAGHSAHRGGISVLGYMLAVIGAISLLLDIRTKLFPPPKGTSDRAPAVQAKLPVPDSDHDASYVIAAALIGVVVGGFGLATVGATAGDLALLASSRGRLATRMSAGIVLAVLAVPAVIYGRRLLERLHDRNVRADNGAETELATLDRWRFGILAVTAAVLVAIGFLLHDSGFAISHGPAIGTLNIVAIFLASFCLIGSLAAHVSNALAGSIPNGEHLAVPTFLRTIGFKEQHSPIIGLLLAWSLLATTVSYGNRYNVRQLTTESARPSQLSVAEAVGQWKAHQPADRTPRMLMVAASGGGVRAQYWTALVMSCIIEMDTSPDGNVCGTQLDPKADQAKLIARRRALFAMSGASGGSVGLLDYVANVGRQWDDDASMTSTGTGWVDTYLGGDFLAAPIATFLFDDLFDSFLRPTHGVDRGEVLERSWERAWPSGSMIFEPFYENQTTGTQPYLMMNGTNVENACRVLVSPIKTQVETDARFCSRSGQLATTPGQAPPHDEAGSTIDLANQLCARCDIRYSTAALASARFPLISPAGRVYASDGGTAIDVVDGGYRENSGASTLVDLWPSVSAAATAAFGSTKDRQCVLPIFLQIDNGYSADATAVSEPIDVNQLLAPVTTERKIADGVEKAARQQSQHLTDVYGRVANWFQITTVAAPGSSAPLGWVLSTDAQDELHRQLQLNAKTITDIRTLLDSTNPPCA